MRRKYKDCVRLDGDCTHCERVQDRKDCKGRPISKLEWARLAANMTQKELAELSGVNARYIQNVELGKSEARNLTARNLLALARTLGVEPESLI